MSSKKNNKTLYSILSVVAGVLIVTILISCGVTIFTRLRNSFDAVEKDDESPSVSTEIDDENSDVHVLSYRNGVKSILASGTEYCLGFGSTELKPNTKYRVQISIDKTGLSLLNMSLMETDGVYKVKYHHNFTGSESPEGEFSINSEAEMLDLDITITSGEDGNCFVLLYLCFEGERTFDEIEAARDIFLDNYLNSLTFTEVIENE